MTAVVLAAGESKRMGSVTPKVLLPINGRPLLSYTIDAVREAGLKRIIVVVGNAWRQIEAIFPDSDMEFAVQAEQRGTADALLSCRDLLGDNEECMVLCGDTPLLTGRTIYRLVDAYQNSGADIVVLTARLENPFGYGRIVRGADGNVEEIIEERDAPRGVKKTTEVNAGVYVFCWGRLRPVLECIRPSSVSGEYYLTDAVRMIRSSGGQVAAVIAEDPKEILGVNTQEQLAEVRSEVGRRSFREQV
ncbi:hypothetical protein CH330_08355 [candidate division WOR-3 bacterium JGI_Cruoil_03_51_56]|uniref:MobA-like NTP transferase domain-containing protein n=1 Tax=candidate division WOR-3 bacterium JGI_Cruoil_03_51_56 TaxID=1973747 RepID=A0A235BRA4_UNCW3|nr:MAG: hypothetical protein CH330_08355 [candidate division WOR-3 bacterium JGI_Cruoil_03_51_56]